MLQRVQSLKRLPFVDNHRPCNIYRVAEGECVRVWLTDCGYLRYLAACHWNDMHERGLIVLDALSVRVVNRLITTAQEKVGVSDGRRHSFSFRIGHMLDRTNFARATLASRVQVFTQSAELITLDVASS